MNDTTRNIKNHIRLIEGIDIVGQIRNSNWFKNSKANIFRGTNSLVNDSKEFTKLHTNTDIDRKPRDTDIDSHNSINDGLEVAIGYRLRNALFATTNINDTIQYSTNTVVVFPIDNKSKIFTSTSVHDFFKHYYQSRHNDDTSIDYVKSIIEVSADDIQSHKNELMIVGDVIITTLDFAISNGLIKDRNGNTSDSLDIIFEIINGGTRERNVSVTLLKNILEKYKHVPNFIDDLLYYIFKNSDNVYSLLHTLVILMESIDIIPKKYLHKAYNTVPNSVLHMPVYFDITTYILSDLKPNSLPNGIYNRITRNSARNPNRMSTFLYVSDDSKYRNMGKDILETIYNTIKEHNITDYPDKINTIEEILGLSNENK